MALIRCKECGGQVSTEAFTCPHCGTPQRQSPPPVPIVVYQPPPKKKQIGLLGGCFLIFLIFILFSVVATVSKQSDSSTSGEVKARQAKAQDESDLSMRLFERSKDAVRRKLKAPSTAKFPGTVFGANEYKVYKMPDGAYRVTSWVDSQNSFGAMIRSQWVVNLREAGGQLEVLQVLIE